MKKKLLITIVGAMIIITAVTSIQIVVATKSNATLGKLSAEVLAENKDYGLCTGVGTFNPENPEKLSAEMKEFIGVPITMYELGTANTISIKIQDNFSYTGNITIIVVGRDDKNRMLDFVTYKFEKSGKYLAKILDISSLIDIESIYSFDIYAWDDECNMIPVTINCNVVNDL